MDQFDDVEAIGRGTFSTVFRANFIPTGTAVALKMIDNYTDLQSKLEIEKEVAIHRQLDHPFIAQYYGHFEHEDKLVIVEEYIKGFSLLDCINTVNRLQEHEAHKIFCQIVSAIRYLHQDKKIAHRDLKLENILLTYQRTVKLIDFGFSHLSTGLLSTQCASFPYAAPEIFQGVKYTDSVDIWALGVILYSILVGSLPFGDEDVFTISKNVLNYEPVYPNHLSPKAIDLLKGLLVKDQTQRITIEQIINHPWTQMSKYSEVISPEVVCIPSLRVYPKRPEDFDVRVLNHMVKMNLNPKDMPVEMFETGDSSETLFYRILRRQNILPEIVSVFTTSICPKRIAMSSNVIGNSIINTNNNIITSPRKETETPHKTKHTKFLPLINSGRKPSKPIQFMLGNTKLPPTGPPSMLKLPAIRTRPSKLPNLIPSPHNHLSTGNLVNNE